MKKSMSEQIIKYLEDRGVKHIFGLCGHTNIAFLAALSAQSGVETLDTKQGSVLPLAIWRPKAP